MRTKTNKQQTAELIKANQLQVSVPVRTRQELVQLKQKQFEEGELTITEFGEELNLSTRDIKFAELYLQEEYLGDGTRAAMVAYEIDPGEKKAKQKAGAIANRLLKHQQVLTLINAALPSMGYSVENAKKQLGYLLNQHVDLKMKAIASKIVLEAEGKLKKTQEISVKHSFDYSSLSKDELLKMKQMLQKAAGVTEKNNDIIDIEPIQ